MRFFRGSRIPAAIVIGVGLVVLSAVESFAGGSCPEEVLSSADMFPWNGTIQPGNSGTEFDASSICTGGVDYSDYLVCFSPTSDCDVSVQMTLSAFSTPYCIGVIAGDCLTNSTAGQITGISSNTTVTTGPISLTAGVDYCAFFETDQDVVLPLVVQEENGTSCGALPVRLERFVVE